MAATSGVTSGRRRRSRASDLPAESTRCVDEEEAFKLLELEVQKGLGIDEESMEDMTESISDADFALSPFCFDFESQWERINQGMDIGPQLDLFSEIVAANKEVAVSQMNYYQLEDEDILLDITDNDKLIIPPRKAVNGLKRPHPTTEEPATFVPGLIAQIKAEPYDSDEEPYDQGLPYKPSNPQMQYVFVEEIATKHRKIITIKRGDKLPPGYKVASVTGELPMHPDDLGDLPASTLPTLRNMVFGSNATVTLPTELMSASFTETSSTSPSTSTFTPAPPSPRSVPTQPPKSKVPSNPTRLNSLSDLMTSEMQRKSTGRLKYKHKSINPVKLQNIISNTAHFTPAAEPEFPQSFEIEGPSLNIIKLASGPAPSSSSSTVRSPPYQKPSLSVIPLNAKSNKGMILLGCKICGEVFPCHEDNLFRRHIFVKHDIEIVDDKYFLDSRIQSDRLLRCRKCKVVVLNKCEEHQLLCLPGLTREAAFEELPINALNWPRKVSHLCGLCGKGFSMRFELRNHTIREHKAFANKMIFDPHFRCVQCLLRFDESYTLGKHCQGCVEMRPRSETVLELAKCLSYCDFCGNSHAGLSESTSCYLNKGIFRCVLCLVTSRDKSNFYRHLHLYHGLTLQEQPKLLIDCPICDFGPEKYTVIFPHVVTEHYAPLLLSSGMGLGQPRPASASSSAPSSTQPAKFTAQRKPTQVGTGTSSSVTTSASIFTSAVRAPSPQGQQAAKRIPPELRPLTPKTATTTTNALPGVVINTNRISQPTRMAGGNLSANVNSSTVTLQLPTSARQMFTPHRSPIIRNPQALASHIITTANNSSIRTQAKASAPGKITIQPNTLANLSSTSPAVRLPMSSLYRPSTTRPTGLVRPQPTGAATMVRPSTTTTSAHPRNPTAMPAILSAVSLVPSNTSNIFTLNGLPVSVVSNYASNGMSRPARPVVSAQRPMGTTTLTSSTATTPTPMRITVMPATARPPIVRPSVFGTTSSTATAPTVARTSSAAPVRTPFIIRLTNTSTVGATATFASSSAASTAKNSVSTNKNIVTPVTQSNSRVILIDGQTIECGYKQDSMTEQGKSNSSSGKQVTYLAKVASTSASLPPVQSRSGFTTVRYPVPNNPLRMPNLPSSISVRPVTPSSAPTTSTSTTDTAASEPKPKSAETPQPPVTTS